MDEPTRDAAPPLLTPLSQPPPSPAPQPAGHVEVDDSKVRACYANFCRVTGTPEELVIDFGLNPQPVGVPTQPIVVTQRIVTNLYTAKRLVQVLQMTVQRHEATFGVLETDVQSAPSAGKPRRRRPGRPPRRSASGSVHSQPRRRNQ